VTWICLPVLLSVVVFELGALGLIQYQMAQKPILRGEVGAQALRVRSMSREKLGGMGVSCCMKKRDSLFNPSYLKPAHVNFTEITSQVNTRKTTQAEPAEQLRLNHEPYSCLRCQLGSEQESLSPVSRWSVKCRHEALEQVDREARRWRVRQRHMRCEDLICSKANPIRRSKAKPFSHLQSHGW
jgi:hypothetical protein